MPQRTVIELLALKLSGEATPRDLAELKELMANSPESVYHEELLNQLFANNKEEDTDNEYNYNLHRLKYQDKLVFAEQNVTAFNHFRTSRQLIAACSLILVLVTAGIFGYYSHKVNSTVYDTEVISGEAMRKKVSLPDGTQVWLNSDSKLAYDKDMTRRGNREVKLTGEAFFDVTHDKAHPFIITTDKISVKVLGTAFNIRAYPKDKKTETTLIRGSIELTVKDRNVEKVILKPSEKFALIDQDQNTKRSATHLQATAQAEPAITMMIQNIAPVKLAGKEYTEEVSWVDNQLVFNNETFEEITPKLERWYNIKLDIQNDEINAYHFTGVFTKEDLTEALTAMKLIKPFNFKIKDHDVTIY